MNAINRSIVLRKTSVNFLLGEIEAESEPGPVSHVQHILKRPSGFRFIPRYELTLAEGKCAPQISRKTVKVAIERPLKAATITH